MTNEEIATNFLFVDLAVKNLQRDLKIIEVGQFKIKKHYVLYTKKLITTAINERRKWKILMDKKKIRIHLFATEGHYITYHFYLNGTIKEITYHKNILKRNVENVIINLQKKMH